MAHSYTKPTGKEIKKDIIKTDENNQEIEEIFKKIENKKVKASELEIEDWRELLEDWAYNPSNAYHNAKDLYKWWLGRKYWLVEQKTEQKYNPDTIII